jgi:hypothetical protein
MAQSRKMSLVETVTQTGTGFVLSLGVANWLLPYFGYPITLHDNVIMTLVFVFANFAKSWVVRRYFNWVEARQERRTAAPTPKGLMAMMAMSQEECEFWMRPRDTGKESRDFVALPYDQFNPGNEPLPFTEEELARVGQH